MTTQVYVECSQIARSQYHHSLVKHRGRIEISDFIYLTAALNANLLILLNRSIEVVPKKFYVYGHNSCFRIYREKVFFILRLFNAAILRRRFKHVLDSELSEKEEKCVEFELFNCCRDFLRKKL